MLQRDHLLALRKQLPMCLKKSSEEPNPYFFLSCQPQAKFSIHWEIRQETK